MKNALSGADIVVIPAGIPRAFYHSSVLIPCIHPLIHPLNSQANPA